MTYEHGFEHVFEHVFGIKKYLNKLVVWFDIYLQVIWITVRIVQGDLPEQRYQEIDIEPNYHYTVERVLHENSGDG